MKMLFSCVLGDFCIVALRRVYGGRDLTGVVFVSVLNTPRKAP